MFAINDMKPFGSHRTPYGNYSHAILPCLINFFLIAAGKTTFFQNQCSLSYCMNGILTIENNTVVGNAFCMSLAYA